MYTPSAESLAVFDQIKAEVDNQRSAALASLTVVTRASEETRGEIRNGDQSQSSYTHANSWFNSLVSAPDSTSAIGMDVLEEVKIVSFDWFVTGSSPQPVFIPLPIKTQVVSQFVPSAESLAVFDELKNEVDKSRSSALVSMRAIGKNNSSCSEYDCESLTAISTRSWWKKSSGYGSGAIDSWKAKREEVVNCGQNESASAESGLYASNQRSATSRLQMLEGLDKVGCRRGSTEAKRTKSVVWWDQVASRNECKKNLDVSRSILKRQTTYVMENTAVPTTRVTRKDDCERIANTKGTEKKGLGLGFTSSHNSLEIKSSLNETEQKKISNGRASQNVSPDDVNVEDSLPHTAANATHSKHVSVSRVGYNASVLQSDRLRRDDEGSAYRKWYGARRKTPSRRKPVFGPMTEKQMEAAEWCNKVKEYHRTLDGEVAENCQLWDRAHIPFQLRASKPSVASGASCGWELNDDLVRRMQGRIRKRAAPGGRRSGRVKTGLKTWWARVQERMSMLASAMASKLEGLSEAVHRLICALQSAVQ
ncbi:hypothetical protein FGB62_74g110 [Gracilaria domingensis]|nr:hypothetical protein FGB62_74g110 [Gracilaria domingensis]